MIDIAAFAKNAQDTADQGVQMSELLIWHNGQTNSLLSDYPEMPGERARALKYHDRGFDLSFGLGT